jgi:WD40 repeat protein
VGGDDGVVRLWDADTGWLQGALRGHTDRIVRLSFRPDGQALASAGGDRTIRLWDLTTFQSKQLLEGQGGHATGLAWRADGRLLAAAGHLDGTAGVLDVVGGPPRLRAFPLFPPGKGFLHDVTLTPEGRFLATANPDGTVYVLRVPDPPPPYDPAPRQLPTAAELAKRPAAADALAPGLSSGLVAELGTGRFRLPNGDNSAITTDREGKWLAVANRDTVAVFDARTGGLVRTLTGHNGRVNAIAFSPDGKLVVSGQCWTAGRVSHSSRDHT